MTWTLFAHRSELSNPGDFAVLGDEVAYNDQGTILVSENKCLHRGARVFKNPHGNGPLKCGYHGFQGDKVLRAQYLTEWVGDWLFAGRGHEPINMQLGELRELIEGAGSRVSSRHGFDVLNMPCDWRTAVENTLEDLHIGAVHPDTFGKLGLKLREMKQYGKNSLAVYEIGDARTVSGLKAMGRYFEKVEPELYFHMLVWPSTCISSVGGLTYSVQHYFPQSGFTKFITRLYSGKRLPDAPNLGYFFDEAVGFNRTVFAQDAEVCASVQGPGTYLTESEQRIRWFRKATP